jgi:hypothetical protein
MPDFENALAKAVMSSLGEETEPEMVCKRPPEIEARRIIDLFDDMNRPCSFSKGDLVTWKQGLKNGRYPQKNYPAIVTRIYKEPITRSDMESGSNHFREPLDLVILVDTGDEVSEFHVDSRRFKLYDGQVDTLDALGDL